MLVFCFKQKSACDVHISYWSSDVGSSDLPEEELESLYGAAVEAPEALAGILERRDQKIVVVSATDVDAFVPYGEAILEAADLYRKPIFLMIDEGQDRKSTRLNSSH